jgi:hypothetical protein
MKIILFILLSIGTASAQFGTLRDGAFVGKIAGGSTSLPTPNLLTQDFTTGSIPAGWVTDGAAPNYGYQWPALLGTYSLGLTNNGVAAYVSFSATADIRFYGQVMFSNTNYNDQSILYFYDGAFATAAQIVFESFDHKLLMADTGSAHVITPNTVIATNTIYHIWAHYKAGSGANGIISLGVSTTASEPTSGSGYAESTVAAGTISPIYLYLTNYGTNQIVWDHLGVSTFTMPTGW